ncbi:hypothetical protein IU470_30440 [Nocardia abscessus]|uniref:Uncharacterized protein n=1 Tax=Nocardia abscessus TaxID=120957 RepID=A0ABS0CGD7_9NOCA|nr:hypothetical protein [Nocardia abscessus]MBF6229396.1 hypothetical protein [Nocardia abscessus]
MKQTDRQSAGNAAPPRNGPVPGRFRGASVVVRHGHCGSARLPHLMAPPYRCDLEPSRQEEDRPEAASVELGGRFRR